MTSKQISKVLYFILTIIVLWSCKKADDTNPLLSLQGSDTVRVVLNSSFSDPGVTATDDTDGDLSQNVAIKTDLNIDKVGFYTAYYTVSDEAGNLSESATRVINVYNESEGYVDSSWVGHDTTLYSSGKVKNEDFKVAINIDSTVNNNIIFSTLSSDKVGEIYGSISKNNIEIPVQEITYNDSLKTTCQGRGSIKDLEIKIHYSFYTDTTSEFRYIRITREKQEE